MRKWSLKRVAFLLFVLAAAGLLQLPAPEILTAEEASPERPKLAVLLVFDQMRGDYLEKWRPLFGEGGFKRLQDEGAWFKNCHYPYAYTLTAPGHTSLVTGATPSRHGIIANDWYDRATGETVTSVTPPPEQKRLGVGPYRRKSQTIGDVLLDVLTGKSRVASLSIKERSAILLAALKAQACYWFDGKSGQFTTSTYYRETRHPWVRKFNDQKLADQWLGKTWERARKDLDYANFSGPDDVFGEGSGYNQGIGFPHPFRLGKDKDAAKAREKLHLAVENSAAGNELLFDLAKIAIADEKLGQTDSTDLLTVSFSSNDLIGHCWGPDSQEVLDITLRSDALVKEFLDLLDRVVGKGKYVVGISADHGVCPLPEVSRKQGKDAGRIAPELLTTQTEAFLNKTYLPAGEKVTWFETPKKQNAWIYLNKRALASLKLEPAQVERKAADWIRTQPGILYAFTRADMTGPAPEGLAGVHEAVKRSFVPESSGDIMVVLKPLYLFSSPILSQNPDKDSSYRTGHGTPHPYDTHVPLLVMGPGIRPGIRDDRVTPQAMASIFARALRLPAPKDAEYPVPDGLFPK
jgi:predicted AlkP superfamily pyrophosphatase or phosphodiesterase